MQHEGNRWSGDTGSTPEKQVASENSSAAALDSLKGLGGKALLVSAGIAAGWIAHEKLVADPFEEFEGEINGRIEALQSEQGANLDQAVRSLRQEGDALSQQLSAEVARLKGEVLEDFTARIDGIESNLGRSQDLHAQRDESLSEQIELVDHSFSDRIQDSEGRLDTLAASVEENQARLSQQLGALSSAVSEVQNHEQRDLIKMWRELVGPVVQLAGDASVGSGVLLKSEYSELTHEYVTPILTAWHVVRDIQGDPPKLELPVPTAVYSEDGSVVNYNAKLLAHDVALDLALLELRTSVPFPNGAKLPTLERVQNIRIFDEIYAVGCPLGNDPIPTRGEVSTRNHEVDGQRYWMINAQTYIGNSGGGIFDTKEHELLGIFSKIYTHGSIRTTIVPHMGLVTPMDKVFSWLDGSGYLSYVSSPGKFDAELAMAKGDRSAAAAGVQLQRDH